jgi:hypothetical protein
MFAFCSACGARIQAAEAGEAHECRFEQLLAYQTRLARTELEHCLETRVAAWEREPRVARRVAFARYVRDRHSAGMPPHRRAA